MNLAIVIPWFGRGLKGGAEQQAWQVASRLAARGHSLEVLTTCCRSHQDDWDTNHLPEGRSVEPEGFSIHRYRVDRRDRQQFDRVCAKLMKIPAASLTPGLSPVTREESSIFVNELIKSLALESFLINHQTNYDAFIFLPYLYGPVIRGVSHVGARACLQPCLHDESYAYLPEVAEAFHAAPTVFLNSEGEAELAARLYGPAVAAKSIVVGEGVESAQQLEHTRNGSAEDPFILYLGRKEPGKNTDMLVRAFRRFRRVRPNSRLRLVLAGYGRVENESISRFITDLGLVPDEEKESLLSSCRALAQPSTNESFSRAIMEAWRHGKPVAVHRDCPATAIEARRARGGWILGPEEEWAAWFAEMDRIGSSELQQLGANGQRHATTASDWDAVIDRYEQALDQRYVRSAPRHSAPRKPSFALDQVLPNLSYGDAISNHALWIRNELRKLGYKSDIFVRFIDPRVAHECQPFSPSALEKSDAVIYHHSIGSEITPRVLAYPRAKCLIYHNITPAEFVEPYRPKFAEILRLGRRDLCHLATHFPFSYGDSAYNADELARAGFHDPKVLPLCVDPQQWAFAPDSELVRELSSGDTNIIFVGRIAPNKKQDDLVRAFALYRALDPTARLFLIGTIEQGDPYADHVRSEVERLALGDAVRLTGNISAEQLVAYYRTADLFWSMSEHEGFCVPLVEAMWFDLPVLAFLSSAVPETLGEAAIMFTDKSSFAGIAALARLLITDERARTSVIAAQRKQRLKFMPDTILPIVRELATELRPRSNMSRIAEHVVAG